MERNGHLTRTERCVEHACCGNHRWQQQHCATAWSFPKQMGKSVVWPQQFSQCITLQAPLDHFSQPKQNQHSKLCHCDLCCGYVGGINRCKTVGLWTKDSAGMLCHPLLQESPQSTLQSTSVSALQLSCDMHQWSKCTLQASAPETWCNAQTHKNAWALGSFSVCWRCGISWIVQCRHRTAKNPQNQTQVRIIQGEFSTGHNWGGSKDCPHAPSSIDKQSGNFRKQNGQKVIEPAKSDRHWMVWRDQRLGQWLGVQCSFHCLQLGKPFHDRTTARPQFCTTTWLFANDGQIAKLNFGNPSRCPITHVSIAWICEIQEKGKLHTKPHSMQEKTLHRKLANKTKIQCANTKIGESAHEHM